MFLVIIAWFILGCIVVGFAKHFKLHYSDKYNQDGVPEPLLFVLSPIFAALGIFVGILFIIGYTIYLAWNYLKVKNLLTVLKNCIVALAKQLYWFVHPIVICYIKFGAFGKGLAKMTDRFFSEPKENIPQAKYEPKIKHIQPSEGDSYSWQHPSLSWRK
jgi:hypothetical protein